MNLLKSLARTTFFFGLIAVVGYSPTACNSQAAAPNSQSTQSLKTATKSKRPASSAAVPATAQTASVAPSGAAEPNTADGRPVMQLGLNFIAYWEWADPFLNLLMTSDPLYGPHRTREWSPASPVDVVRSGLMDPVTFEFKALGPFASIHVGWFKAPEPVVIEWDGDGDVGIGICQGDATRPGPRRIDFVPAPTERARCYLNVTRINAADPARNFRVYYKSNEARVRAGEVFSPQFLALARRYKVLRFMDWMQTSSNPARLASQIKSDAAVRLSNAPSEFESETGDASMGLYGVSPRLQFRLGREADAAVWTNIPPFLGADAEGVRLLFAKTPPAGVDVKAAAKARARATFRQQIASAEWDRYADRLVAAMIAENYPVNRTVYIELGNEIWNFAYSFNLASNWYTWIGDALYGRDWEFRKAYGYMSGRVAEAISAALSRAGRSGQRWTLVIAGFAVNPDTTTQALIGYRQYFTDKGVDPASWLARAGVSVASYYGDGFDPTRSAFAPLAARLGVRDRTDAYKQAVLAEIKRDPMAAARKVADDIVNRLIPKAARDRSEHAAIARRNGATFIGDYEGGDHENGLDYDGDVFAKDPDYQAMMKEIRYGAEGERITRAWLEAMKTSEPDAMIANYFGPSTAARPGGYGNPWEDGYYGEPDGRSRALDAVLRPEQTIR